MIAKAKLYGVGVGPGDIELLTLKAARLLNEVKVIAYPSADGGESLARRAPLGCRGRLRIHFRRMDASCPQRPRDCV